MSPTRDRRLLGLSDVSLTSVLFAWTVAAPDTGDARKGIGGFRICIFVLFAFVCFRGSEFSHFRFFSVASLFGIPEPSSIRD